MNTSTLYQPIKHIFCVLLFISCIFIHAQELPPIINYTPSEYGADNQNWMASQSDDGIVYIANNKGLLSFNGAQWILNPSPNETILRSVKVVADRVYTGAYMDFGYWESQENGILLYTSLTQKLAVKMIEDEQIWKIISYNDKILLQSFNRIYIYQPDNDQLEYIEIEHDIYRLFQLDEDLYFQVLTKGLYSIKNGKAVLINDHEILKTKTFINLFKKDSIIIGITQEDGFFIIKDQEVVPWEHTASTFLKDITVYSSIELKDKSIAVGTVANGFLKLSQKGDLEYQCKQESGLGNNTALSLFEDSTQNVWIGLDNGIACINTHVPIVSYSDQKGRLGATYESVVYEGDLYLGTNQGLFYKKKNTSEFKLVSGIEEQVWMLSVIDGELFCGHNKGTFLIKDGKQQQIATVDGTWNIKKIPNTPDLLLQGNFDGLYILEKKNGDWSLRNKLEGFDISSKHFEVTTNNKILVSHEYKGVFEVQADAAFAKAISYKQNTSVTKGEYSSLTRFDNAIFYANKEGIHKFDVATSTFIKNETLSTVYQDEYISGKLVNDQEGKLWAFTEKHLVYFTKDQLESKFSVHKIQIPQSLRNSVKGYEDITQLDAKTYLLGTTNGYLAMDISLPTTTYNVTINRIASKKIDGSSILVPLNQKGDFLWEENTMSFFYHIPEYDKFQIAQYQHRLKGYYDTWSSWGATPSFEYANIPSGDYTFEVRARVGNVVSANIAEYIFTIGKPWYLSDISMIMYVLSGILLFIALNWFYKRYYRKQRERLLEKTKQEMDLKALEIEKENIELRNQNLRNDIDARNRELASSTMSMLNKSKMLNEIKEKLIKINISNNLDTIIKDIDKNINTKEDWNFFEEAFNHADKDFFKKVKKVHPALTSNDLKLCVYLRLNMSSKEIAPLLNISHRSVEIKRYRLRKKINLDHSIHLNDYFINL